MNIASLSPAATEILFALGAEDRIVCTDQFSQYPEEARSLPHVRDHAKVHPEEVQEYGADLVITGTVVQERLSKELQAYGLSVLHQDPRTIHQIYDSIRALGLLLQKESEAQSLILHMQQSFNDVKRKAALLPKRLKLYIEEWPACVRHGGSSAGRPENAGFSSEECTLPFVSGNWVPEVARIAGGEQFPVPDGELSLEVSLKQVQEFDPDMIIISWCGAGSLADADLLKNRSGWDSLRAVSENQIRVIDDSLLNRPGPRLVEGAQRLYGWMFEVLH